MAGKSSPHKRVKRRKPTAVEQETPRFAAPQLPASPSPSPHSSSPAPTPTSAKASKRAGLLTTVPAPDAPQASEVTVPPVLACILPPHLAYLKDSYSLATMSVISSSKIEQKVKMLLQHLERFSYGKIDAKPGLVALHAKASVANKMISVIEIAKRTVKGGKLYQYSRLSGELTELKTKGKEGDGEASQRKEDDDSDSAFETMTSPRRPKVRAVPVLTVYLARVPVVELATEFGQQTMG